MPHCPAPGHRPGEAAATCETARVTRPSTVPPTRPRIAYQGEPGANSHLVCRQHYPDWEAMACASFEDIFAAVESGEAKLAMIPIDNSIAGRVADIHHFLPSSGLHIIGGRFLRIQFSLMAIPGASLDSIRTVHSHVHALGQCRGVIRELGLKPVVAGDTAGAAREVAEFADATQAAIAPPLAAEIYGLRVLRNDVEDEDHNTTRFIVLSRGSRSRPPPTTARSSPVSSSQRPKPAGCALQGPRRPCDQRRQHDQAGGPWLAPSSPRPSSLPRSTGTPRTSG